MNRRTEILIGSIIILAILAFFGLKILDVSFDSDSVLEKLDTAIAEGDLDYLKSHLEVRGVSRDLTDKEVGNIAEGLKDKSVYSFSDQREDPDANIYLKKKGREKLIYDKYTIVLKPYELTISSNIKGTKILIDDEEVGEFKEDEDFVYKDLMPGSHSVKLKHSGEYAEIETEEQVLALNSNGSTEIYLNLELEGRYIYIESNLEDATLFVDGKDTEINIYDEYKFGPIDDKKKIKIAAKAKIDGEEHSSETIEIATSSGSHHSLNIEYEEPMSKEEVLRKVDTLIEGYETALVRAINYGSYSYLDSYIEYGSPFMKAQKKLVANLSEKGISEDLLSYEVEEVSILSKELISVIVSESHMLYYSSGDKKQVDNKWTYTVANIDEQLFIRDIKKAK